MEQKFIYIVGKPNSKANIKEAATKYGYKLGILSDEKLDLKNPEIYDRIEKVDFSDIDNELERLAQSNLNAAGLLCTYENYIIAKSKIGEYFNLPVQSVESAKLSTNKNLMRQAIIDYDPAISPQFSVINTTEQAVEFGQQYGYPLILKPASLVKSLLVLKCDNEQELITNFDYAKATIAKLYEKYNAYNQKPELIIEEFINGRQCSIAAYVDIDGKAHFCEGIVDLTSSQDLGIDDNYLYKRKLPNKLDPNLSDKLFETAKKGIEALKMSSVPAHVELMYDGDEVKIIEIGARTGGYRPRMYKYSYNLDLIDQEVRLAVGMNPELSRDLISFCAVYELFPDQEGLFSDIENIIEANDVAYFRITAKPGDNIGPAKNGYKATAIVIVNETDEVVFSEKCRLVELMKVNVN